MDMVLGLNVNLKLVSLFSVIYCWYILDLPQRQFQCVSTIYVFPIIKCFTISFS